MKKQPRFAGPCDVFLSHGPREKSLATLVKQRMEDFGLSVVLVSPADWQGGLEAAGPIRQALLGSSAVVALVSPSYKEAENLLVELGAAWQEQLPVHLLLAEDDVGELPVFMRRFRNWPLDRLSKLIATIVRHGKPAPAKPA
jgi:hypothetical protein